MSRNRQIRLVAPAPKMRVRLLGRLAVEAGGASVDRFRTQKTGNLLAYLALHGGTSVGREELVELFWPDAPEKGGQQSLRTALSSLQRALAGLGGSRVLVSDRAAVWLDASVVDTDVGRFERALAEGRLAEAVDVYEGPLLPGRYDDWAVAERERLAALYVEALVLLAGEREAADDPAAAAEIARRAVAADPLREDAHVLLVRALTASGDVAGARKQYEALERMLRDELGIAPGDEARAVKPAPAPAPRPAPRLPHSLTRFFGRERDLEALEALLVDRGDRLVTLTGPGGAGKTRLALAAARRLAPAFGGEAVFVPLEHLGRAAEIPRAVLDALGVEREPGVEAGQQVAEALAERRALLVLDNFEHLVDEGAAIVAALLGRAPRVAALVTSRRVLNLTGETAYTVAPLPVPGPASGASDLEANESVALFVDRARLARPDFRLTEANAAAVAAVCASLEGIPLAIELAAAWSRVLAPSEILERVERRRFDVLVGEQPDRPARHRSFRAAIEGSYRMLPPALRRVFARLSVFRGGWTLEMAERVAGVPGLEKELQTLGEWSLVVAEERGAGMRLRMLETLREFAAEQLGSEVDVLARRHAEAFVDFAESWESKRFGVEEAGWVARFEAETGNFRAALEWCAARGDGELMLRLAATLAQFWHVRGYRREGASWLERALEAAPEAPAAVRAKALWWLGLASYDRGDVAGARSRCEESLALAREAGATASAASALYALAGLAGLTGEYERSERLATEALAAAREAGDVRREAGMLGQLGLVARAVGRFDEAEAWIDESLRLYESIGWRSGLAIGYYNAGELERLRGDAEAAAAHFAESLAIAREMKDDHAEALASRGAGVAALERGDYGSAADLIGEALVVFRRLGEMPELATTLDALACLAAARGDDERALGLEGAAEAMRDRAGAVASPTERAARDRALAASRERLGPAASRRAFDAGRGLSLEDVVSEG